MNELGRQSYLTAMGIDSYIPRMLLNNIPTPYLCEESIVNAFAAPIVDVTPTSDAIEPHSQQYKTPSIHGSSPNRTVGAQAVQDVLKSMGMKSSSPASKEKGIEVDTVTLKGDASENSALFVEPFILTVWRPREDILIVDAHHKGEAYPTHTLLLNIFKSLWSQDIILAEGDRVAFPLINNKRGGITTKHMRDSLQTWFTAEYEKRPCPVVWLMGENATQFLLSENDSFDNALWQEVSIELEGFTARPFSATVLPSLTDLLIAPELKQKLWRILQVSNVRIC